MNRAPLTEFATTTYMYSIVTLGKSPHLRSLETSSFLKGKIQSFAGCTLVLSLKYNIRNSLLQ